MRTDTYIAMLEDIIRGPEGDQQRERLKTLESAYEATFPVEHQPLDIKQHRKNFLQYNVKAKKRDGFVSSLALINTVLLVLFTIEQLSSEILPIILGLALFTLFVALCSRITFKIWLSKHPIEEHVVWYIRDYQG